MEGEINKGNIIDCFDANNFTDTVEFGRESLGILPPDFYRESLGILFSDPGRQSLGFSNSFFLNDINTPLECRNFSQISNFDHEQLDTGKESLGILNLTSIDKMLGMQSSKVPDLILTTVSETESVCDIFNNGFLLCSPRKSSLTSTFSHISFNTNSVEEPSKIFSLTSANDDVFSNSATDLVPFGLSSKSIMAPNGRLRVQSLPNMGIINKTNSGNNDNLMNVTDNYVCNYNEESAPSLLNKGYLLSATEMDNQSKINTSPIVTRSDVLNRELSFFENYTEPTAKTQSNDLTSKLTSTVDKENICVNLM